MERRHPSLYFLTVPGGIENPLTVQASLSIDAYIFTNHNHFSQLNSPFRLKTRLLIRRWRGFNLTHWCAIGFQAGAFEGLHCFGRMYDASSMEQARGPEIHDHPYWYIAGKSFVSKAGFNKGSFLQETGVRLGYGLGMEERLSSTEKVR